MSRVEELLAKQKQLEEDLKLAMEEERDTVVADVREKIKRYNITAPSHVSVIDKRLRLACVSCPTALQQG